MSEIKIYEACMDLVPMGTAEDQSIRFARFHFTVGPHCTKLLITLFYECKHQAQFPICLFDPEGKVRIMRASEGLSGRIRKEFILSMESASEGAIPGPLPEGEWKLILYKRRFSEKVSMHIKTEASYHQGREKSRQHSNPAVDELEKNPFSSRILDKPTGCKWYSGELHTHSQESTGRTTVLEILKVAKEQQLDFIALTDHFTASHWLKIQELNYDGPPLFLQSMEVSGDRGHANVHGLQHWINPLVDDNEELASFLGLPKRPSMEWIADQVHAQGGLFSINHALSGGVAWRYFDFPMEKADLFEIWCTPDKTTTFLYPTMWDMLLCQGYHLTGVGSSDSHNPGDEGPWKLGMIRTWVFANDLSQKSILAGLKAGKAYISIGKVTMQYHASTKDGTYYEMGDCIQPKEGESIQFSVTINNHTSGNLFVIASGMIFDVHYLAAGLQDSISWSVTSDSLPKISNGSSYMRLEFHEDKVKPEYWGMAWRDHTSMRFLSNPIWIQNIEG